MTPTRPRPTSQLAALATVACLLLAPMSAAQRSQADPADATTSSEGAATQELPPVEAPPELDARQQQKLDRALGKLRNSNVERRADTEQQIIAFGRGALPALLDATKANHAGKQDGLVVCLTALADLRDRELVAGMLDSEQVVRRRFAVIATGRMGLPDQVQRLLTMLADEDQVVAVEAALALVTHGHEEGLSPLIDVYETRWKQRVLAALPGVVDQGIHLPLAVRLKADPERLQFEPEAVAAEQLATVHMFHAIGDQHSRMALRKALDISNNLVQRAAINALRDLLEDKPPMKAGSIFAQVAEVKRLKLLGANQR